MIKTMLRWTVVNSAVLAFVIFGQSLLPAAVFHGAAFVLMAIISAIGLIFLVSIFVLMVFPDETEMRRLRTMKAAWTRPRWFWFLDIAFDLVLIGAMAGMGLQALAFVYCLTLGLFWILKWLLELAVEEGDLIDWLDSLNSDSEPDYEDLPEYMRDQP